MSATLSTHDPMPAGLKIVGALQIRRHGQPSLHIVAGNGATNAFVMLMDRMSTVVIHRHPIRGLSALADALRQDRYTLPVTPAAVDGDDPSFDFSQTLAAFLKTHRVVLDTSFQPATRTT
jgi:hypothetical protein